MASTESVIVVGAGPVGCVLAVLLARRGFDVEMFEKRPDMRRADITGGRSINLVLTDRGLRALERIGLRDEILELTVAVRGRMMHSTDGELSYQPYGKDESECNYSVSRGRLNEFLLDAAADRGVEIHFQREVADLDVDAGRLIFDDGSETEAGLVFGCDGAPSAVRKALVDRCGFDESVEFMSWGYKELLFPAGPDNTYRMEKNALHIWPRGEHFLMGLANLDGSFTGTLYLPREGKYSFAELDNPRRLQAFFDEYYADAVEVLGDFVDEFLAHPTGKLGTVRCAPWQVGDRVLLLGDAAHGIVPFFGQGLNCGFEDCVVLDDLLEEGGSLEAIFETFFQQRKSNTDAIADMALENAVEMGDKVSDPDFLFRKKVESVVERELPSLYRTRYAMVMYSTIPYRVVFEIGEVQKELIAELSKGLEQAEEVDLDMARELIEARLQPLYERHGVELGF